MLKSSTGIAFKLIIQLLFKIQGVLFKSTLYEWITTRDMMHVNEQEQQKNPNT